jgi:pyruvate kinase
MRHLAAPRSSPPSAPLQRRENALTHDRGRARRVRSNFSHGRDGEHRKRVELVRELARKARRTVGVLVDLQGENPHPAAAAGEKPSDRRGSLDAECTPAISIRRADYRNLPNDVKPGDTLLLDDGRIVLCLH